MANAASQLSVIGRLARWGLFLSLLYRHDEMGNLSVAGPVAGEFANERDAVGYFKAPNFFGEMGKELERRHLFVVGVFVAEGDIMDLIEGV